ncbi:hypothetical protein [Kitasatospora azatica]|uniref:hypothetical protein n=1 Tax=Kitasatospora azatica TaxID=58347 RepID=UPI000565675E|nr:hypothetical protein [Kitasatospora azatica]
MSGHGATARRAGARLLLLCAVLVGLFLMHGAPATAVGGCHDGARTVSMPSHAMHPAEPVAAPVPDPMTEPMAERLSPAATHATANAAAHAPAHGGSCLATQARSSVPLPVAAAVAAVLVLQIGVPRPRLGLGRRARRRGPPDSGRQLLLQVCVARN